MKLNAQVIVRACSGLNFILIWGGIWLDDRISSNWLFYPLMTLLLVLNYYKDNVRNNHRASI